jgi:uncharacterized damage-inducible protein DinB
MRLIDPILAELEQESATTRRVLERVPGDQLGWKPHPKSFSLGQQALHIATIPGNVAGMLSGPGFPEPPQFGQPEAGSLKEILDGHDAGLKAAQAALNGWDDAHALGTWSLKSGERVLLAAPRIALARAILLNHLYHHRGELQVYLRLLNVPLPSVYGPTADETPFV